MPNVHDFTVSAADGSPVALSDFDDKLLLIVNVASKCGFTPQYEGLESLYEELHDKGLEIIGFPCNQFGDQEPGTAEEIQEFCSLNYGVSFPVLAKIEVNGDAAEPLYSYLRSEAPGDFSPTSERGQRLRDYIEKVNPEALAGDDVKWNFTKFLVGRDGTVIRRYETYVTPEEIKPDLEALLA